MNKRFMQLISWKTGLLTLTLLGLTTVSGVLTACSNTSQSNSTPSQNQSQAPNSPATAASDQPNTHHGSGMEHGSSMNHSMSMDLGPADADYELRFIDAMTLHHQGAVQMAKEAQQKSQRPEIKNLADDIIKAQNKEINQLKQWRQAWYPKAGDKPMAYHASQNHMMEMSADQMKGMMMSKDLGSADAQFDLRFIDAMIPHHEGALVMAEDALKKSQRPEIKQLAQDIITSQQKEIDQMKQWQKAWYNK